MEFVTSALSNVASPLTICSADEESPLCSEAVARAVASPTKVFTAAVLANTGHVTSALALDDAVAPYLERTVSRSVTTLPPADTPAGSSTRKEGDAWNAPPVRLMGGEEEPSTT